MNTPIDWSSLIGARVQGLQEYAPEPLEEIALRLNLPVGQLIKLDANENPYGPTAHALAALGGWHAHHRYPDPVSRRLRQAIGAYLGVDAAQILVGNGSDELIDLLLRLFRPDFARQNATVADSRVKPGAPMAQVGGIGQVIICPPTFGMYEFYGATNDLEVLCVPRDAAFGVDLDRIEALCAADPRPKIAFFASPNNPDGALLPDAALERLLALPLLVVLDEAYIEFSGASRVGLVAEHDNLIVLRTFSKWAGLAGLRVGYGVYPAALMSGLWRLKSPYNVNGVAQAAALATLEDLPQAQANVDKIVAERARLVNKLTELPYLTVYPTQANYVLCRVHGRPIAALRAAMERHGIILRYFGGPLLGDCVRISVGTPMQDEALLLVLRSLEQSGGTA
jgi:histidinol-phosphate aminotransferase